MDRFKKVCYIDYEDVAKTESVRVCRKKPTRDCDADTENMADVCEDIPETICETTYKTVEVDDDQPECVTVQETMCDKDSEGNDINCMEVPVKVTKPNITDNYHF